jgi:DNA-binding NarL/FixJ family response regulator
MTVRVVMAEDSLLAREGVVQVLERADDIEIVATCSDEDAGEQPATQVRAHPKSAQPGLSIKRVSDVAPVNPGSPPKAVRVLAVDDAAAFRRAVRTLLQRTPRLDLVGEADTGERALAVAASCDPDLVLMDVRMPGMGGLAAAKAMKAARPATVVVLISTEHPSDLPAEASTCGADEIVWKSELRAGVVEAIWLEHRPGDAA